MAALDSTNRARITAQWMRENAETCGFTKAQLRAAVDATDAWIDANAAGFNTALPAAFRTSASAAQKTLLFCFVAMRRAGTLRTEED
jgi:hypothetical protein